MSTYPVGTSTPSIDRIFFWIARDSGTPPEQIPTSAISSAPLFFSRISWVMRETTRSTPLASKITFFPLFFMSHDLFGWAGCLRRAKKKTPQAKGGGVERCGEKFPTLCTQHE